MGRPSKGSFNRRGFLKGAAVGAAAGAAKIVSGIPTAEAQQPAAPLAAAPPTAAQMARETGAPPADADPRIIENPGSDFMVDVFRAMGIEYVAANPGSSFDGLQESIINYGDNKSPEFLTCCHEESAVAMAHGWAKIEGKPTLMPLLHGTIGIQHGSMAVYNAYCDRVPIFMIAGLDYEGPITAHNATDMATMLRGYLKWDNQPASLNEFTQSVFRAYRLAATPPMAPVLVVIDASVQKDPMSGRRPAVPKLTLPQPPAADIGSVREVARMLVAAENPRVNAGRMARTPKGIELLVELADLLQMPVNSGGDRVNFPSRHAMAGVGSGQADLILNLEADGGAAANADGSRPKVITISSVELMTTSNYNVVANAPQGDLIIAADAEASLPAIVEEVKRLVTPDRKRVFDQRGLKHAEANAKARAQAIDAARYGWDSSPISLARLAAELWPLIKNEDWSMVSPQGFISNWPNRLWNMDKHYRHIGSWGGAGMGYGAPAAVGAALANRKYGRLTINIQQDGDLNYAPGVLWTAAHHKIPLLTIMHNNRGYHQEVMFLQRQASARNRNPDRAHIGTRLIDPNIDYAKMAQAYGMYGEGPITNPGDLAAAFKRGIEQVKRGEPALIDVVTQPR
jgi:thiamine pyrophosphate-dependent acetolactate synthase large subunit-like protein